MMLAALTATAAAAESRQEAQVREVAGRVIDRVTGEPVTGATVSLGAKTVSTSPDGSFRLPAGDGARVLQVLADDYFEATVLASETGETVIELLPRTFEEESVEVTAEAPVLDRPAATRVAPAEVLQTAGTVDNIFRALATLPGGSAHLGLRKLPFSARWHSRPEPDPHGRS